MGNNPVNLTDPSGEFAFIPLLLVAAAGGALGGVGYYAIQTALNPCVEWNWGEALFWTGAGTVIGAALGGGIYGGWWIGVQAAWWGPAAGGGVAAQQIAQRAGSVWRLPPFQRGNIIHRLLGQNLPSNFPKIDRFANGIATSIKSIDLGAASYQNISTLMNTVRGYINTMANYQGQPTRWSGVIIYPHQITARAVDLAIPASGVTPAQLAALQQLQRYASSLGVTLNIIPVP